MEVEDDLERGLKRLAEFEQEQDLLKERVDKKVEVEGRRNESKDIEIENLKRRKRIRPSSKKERERQRKRRRI